jgi:hypothetical protein
MGGSTVSIGGGPMKWIRIGNRVLDPSAIIEATEDSGVELATGEQRRVVSLLLSNGRKLTFAGEEADLVWKKLTDGIEVWTDTYQPPEDRMGFH